MTDVGGTSFSVLLLLVNYQAKLLGLIGQNIGGWSRQNRMLGERKQCKAYAMIPLPETDTG